MQKRNSLYGAIVLLIALLIIVASIAGYYAFQYSQEVQANHTYVSELDSANQAYSAAAAKYDALASRYNGSLSSVQQLASLYNESVAAFNNVTLVYESLESQYNASLSLLVSAISELNTSTPAYRSASVELAGLWRSYSSLALNYSSAQKQFENISASFRNILLAVSNSTGALKTQTPLPLSLAYSSNILLDFGNGTSEWYNDTQVQPGWNLYVATLLVTSGNVNATWYPQYGEHYVTGIDGVQNSATRFWFVWMYNTTSLSWENSQVGADQLPTFNGSTFAWTYCVQNLTTFAPECTPGK